MSTQREFSCLLVGETSQGSGSGEWKKYGYSNISVFALELHKQGRAQCCRHITAQSVLTQRDIPEEGRYKKRLHLD